MNFNPTATPKRPLTQYNMINVYTNDGHSEYNALILGLNGIVRGGHLLTGSVTFADKQNINDDFSPELPFGYPERPGEHRGRLRPQPRRRALSRRPERDLPRAVGRHDRSDVGVRLGAAVEPPSRL